MARSAPVFRPLYWKPREAWERPAGWKDKRKRGRAGQRDRAAVLAEEPFCRLCLEHGQHVRAVEVDHIKPLAFGGSDDRSNKQALCKPCHAAKSASERKNAPRSQKI